MVGDQKARVQIVPPGGRAAALLVDRESLREPARHAVVGEREMKDVGDLVPEGRRPVELAPAARGRGIHGHHRAEAHPQRPEAGEPDRAYGEIGVTGEEFKPDRGGWVVLVALGQGLIGPLGQLGHERGQQLRFPTVDGDDEVLGLGDAIALEGVEEIEGVLVPRVEGIALEGPLEFGLTFFDRAHPQLVDAQDAACLPGIGIDSHSLGGERDGVRVAARLHRHVGHGGEEARVLRVQRTHLLADGLEVLVAVAQEPGGREHRERLQRRRVHLQRGTRLLLGRRVLLQTQMQASQQCTGRDQVGIDFEGAPRRAHGLGRAVEFVRQRHPQDRLRMAGIAGEHLLV